MQRTKKSLFTDEEYSDFETKHIRKKLENVSLKDIPLEDRRKEAKKPLYLTRYE